MSNDIEAIQNVFLALTGKPAWGLTRTHGSMFLLEIGGVLKMLVGKPVGEWHFLVEMCNWRFQTEKERVVGSEDNKEVIDQVFATLKLGTIESCTVSSPFYDLKVCFSTGLQLITFSALTKPEEQWSEWTLYLPDDHVWFVDSADSLKFE